MGEACGWVVRVGRAGAWEKRAVISVFDAILRLCAILNKSLSGQKTLGRVAEWQTRWLQVPVSFGTWGFKSPFAHHNEKP